MSCEAPDCSHESVCWDAILCYTAHVRDVDGIEMKSKGCASTISQVSTRIEMKSKGCAFTISQVSTRIEMKSKGCASTISQVSTAYR